MTQENKDLLLKDLCARLPYGTRVYAQNANDWYDDELNTLVLSEAINGDYIIKPYLFPLSSMTEEQNKEWLYTLSSDYHITFDTVDWYNKNHFDYRGLIPMGLAIDATGLNIY